MRKIRFRAWDGNQMHDDVSPWRWDFVISNTWHRCEKSTGNGILGNGGNTAEMLVPAIRFKELMQFTGLKDKHGKEVFEGDIVNVFDWGSERKLLGVCKMVWDTDETGWNFEPFIIEDRYDFIKSLNFCEVIGNIHEHPHLISQ